MGAACYASVAGATSKDPYSLILIGIESCVLRLCGGSHLQRPLFRDTDRNWELRTTPSWRKPPLDPNSIEAWELRAMPLCGSHLQNPYPCMWALWGRIIIHICLWGVSMVLWDDGLWGRLLVCQSCGYYSLVIHGYKGIARSSQFQSISGNKGL